MTIRLSLICHAATPALRTATVPDDESVDESGLAAVTAMAAGWEGADRCWSAPERRARETAAALGLVAEIEERLRDCDYGQWRGMSLRTLQADQPAAVQEWLADPAAAPHGGESVLMLMARIGGWLDELLLSHPVSLVRVIAVTHPAVIRAAIVHALGAAPAAFWRIDVAPLGCVCLSGRIGRWNLAAMEQPERPQRR